MLKAAQAQGESQKQGVVKKQVREKRAALEAAGIDGAEVDGLIRTLEDQAARETLVSVKGPEGRRGGRCCARRKTAESGRWADHRIAVGED